LNDEPTFFNVTGLVTSVMPLYYSPMIFIISFHLFRNNQANSTKVAGREGTLINKTYRLLNFFQCSVAAGYKYIQFFGRVAYK